MVLCGLSYEDLIKKYNYLHTISKFIIKNAFYDKINNKLEKECIMESLLVKIEVKENKFSISYIDCYCTGDIIYKITGLYNGDSLVYNYFNEAEPTRNNTEICYYEKQSCIPNIFTGIIQILINDYNYRKINRVKSARK